MDSGVIEFFVKMQDLMSPALKKLRGEAQSDFAKMSADFHKVKSDSEFFGHSLNELRTQLKAVNEVRAGTVLKSEFREATKEAQRLEKEITKMEGKRRGAGIWGNIKSGIGAMLPVFGAAYVGREAYDFGKESLQAAMNYEVKEKMFQALTGSRTGGTQVASDLFKLSQRAGFGKDVYQNAQMLLGYGVKQDDVLTVLKQIGAVTMGNTMRAKEMTLAYAQTMAAGKLIGKDLRQFVASGFNPLQTISQHWKEFGFKTKVTIGELQEQLKKGTITANMVKKAFDIATSAGGKFGGTLDAIADTTQGKLQEMRGQWEAIKVTLGEHLMPVAERLMDVMKGVFGWVDTSQNVAVKLMQEKANIDALVAAATNANTTIEERKTLLDQLFAKYPDLFGFLDKEKVTNNQLEGALKGVNEQYSRMIELAGNKALIDANDKLANSNWQKYVINNEIADNYANHNDSGAESLGGKWGMIGLIPATRSQTVDMYRQRAAEAKKKFEAAQEIKNVAAANNDIINTQEGIKSMQAAFNNNKAIHKAMLAAGATNDVFNAMTLSNQLRRAATHRENTVAPSGYNKFKDIYDKLTKGTGVVPPGGESGEGGEGEGTGTGKGRRTADGITGSGPRVINIYGVKFAEKIEVTHIDPKKSEEELERILTDMYLRVLNSGATVQG